MSHPKDKNLVDSVDGETTYANTTQDQWAVLADQSSLTHGHAHLPVPQSRQALRSRVFQFRSKGASAPSQVSHGAGSYNALQHLLLERQPIPRQHQHHPLKHQQNALTSSPVTTSRAQGDGMRSTADQPKLLRSPAMDQVCTPPSDKKQASPAISSVSSPASSSSSSSSEQERFSVPASLLSRAQHHSHTSRIHTHKIQEVKTPMTQHVSTQPMPMSPERLGESSLHTQREVSLVGNVKAFRHGQHATPSARQQARRASGLVDATYSEATEEKLAAASVISHAGTSSVMQTPLPVSRIVPHHADVFAGVTNPSTQGSQNKETSVLNGEDRCQEWALTVLQEAERQLAMSTARHGQLIKSMLSTTPCDTCAFGDPNTTTESGKKGEQGAVIATATPRQHLSCSPASSMVYPHTPVNAHAQLRPLELAMAREQQTLIFAERMLQEWPEGRHHAGISPQPQREQANEAAQNTSVRNSWNSEGSEAVRWDHETKVSPLTATTSSLPSAESLGTATARSTNAHPSRSPSQEAPKDPMDGPAMSTSRAYLKRVALKAHRRLSVLHRRLLLAQEDVARQGLEQLAAAAIFSLTVHFLSDPPPAHGTHVSDAESAQASTASPSRRLALVPLGWQQEKRTIARIAHWQAKAEVLEKQVVNLYEEVAMMQDLHRQEVLQYQADVRHLRSDHAGMVEQMAVAAVATLEVLERRTREQLAACEADAWKLLKRTHRERIERHHRWQRLLHEQQQHAARDVMDQQRHQDVPWVLARLLVERLEESERRCRVQEEAEHWENTCLLQWRLLSMRRTALDAAAVRGPTPRLVPQSQQSFLLTQPLQQQQQPRVRAENSRTHLSQRPDRAFLTSPPRDGHDRDTPGALVTPRHKEDDGGGPRARSTDSPWDRGLGPSVERSPVPLKPPTFARWELEEQPADEDKDRDRDGRGAAQYSLSKDKTAAVADGVAVGVIDVSSIRSTPAKPLEEPSVRQGAAGGHRPATEKEARKLFTLPQPEIKPERSAPPPPPPPPPLPQRETGSEGRRYRTSPPSGRALFSLLSPTMGAEVSG